MFFNPMVRQLLRGAGHHPNASGPFREIYECYSTPFLTDRDRPNLDKGGKILLPESVLEHLAEQVCFLLIENFSQFLLNRIVFDY